MELNIANYENYKKKIDYCHVKESYCDEGVNCDDFTDSLEDGDPPVFKCTNFAFDNSTWHKTVITEWNLVCDQAAEAAVPDEAYMIGMAISMLTMGGVSDMYGRRRTLFWCHFALCIISFAQIFAHNLYGFAVTRFFQGLYQVSLDQDRPVRLKSNSPPNGPLYFA